MTDPSTAPGMNSTTARPNPPVWIWWSAISNETVSPPEWVSTAWSIHGAIFSDRRWDDISPPRSPLLRGLLHIPAGSLHMKRVEALHRWVSDATLGLRADSLPIPT